MTVDRQSVLAGIAIELEGFSALLRSLDPGALDAPTRCDGWSVANVASHVIGTIVDVTQGRLDGQGTPEVTQRQADERPGRSPAELADELDEAMPALMTLLEALPAEAWDGPSLGDPAYTLGFAVEAIWFDAYLHADDIRTAIGAPARQESGLNAAIHHVAGYLDHRGDAMTLDLDGMDAIDVGAGGNVVTGDPYRFLLAATGRADTSSAGVDPSLNVYAE
jgi:uncharacterized protein (TIGR03083 family)